MQANELCALLYHWVAICGLAYLLDWRLPVYFCVPSMWVSLKPPPDT